MKARKNLFSKRREYWQKIRAPIPLEDEICRQIQEFNITECDKYLIGRACVRNKYMRAYSMLELLPEVNIIVEAYVRNLPLFNELSRAEHKYVAMDDHTEQAFQPRIVTEWYNVGTTDTTTTNFMMPSVYLQMKQHIRRHLLQTIHML
jgi:hypothetical protein